MLLNFKKFENTSSNDNFELSEIGDIIREFASTFGVEEDDILFGAGPDSYIGIEDLLNIDKLDLQLSSYEFEEKYNFEKIEKVLSIRLELGLIYSAETIDFNIECDRYLEIFKKLKSFSGKLETFGLSILGGSLDFELVDGYSISFYIDKENENILL